MALLQIPKIVIPHRKLKHLSVNSYFKYAEKDVLD
jgi:hypothetical protein